MDIRAFGSVYRQTAALPYASGFCWSPEEGRKDFSTCRGIYIETRSIPAQDYVTVELSDSPGQHITLSNIERNTSFEFACTALISGSVVGVIALF